MLEYETAKKVGELLMIAGTRVALRPFLPEDLPALRRWHNDPEVMRFCNRRFPLLPAHSFEADRAPDGPFTRFGEDGYFCICDEPGWAIGQIEYEGFRLPNRSAELSILIGEKDVWSKGYGAEALVLLLEYLQTDKRKPAPIAGSGLPAFVLSTQHSALSTSSSNPCRPAASPGPRTSPGCP